MSALDDLLVDSILRKRPGDASYDRDDRKRYDAALAALRERWTELENAENTAAANRKVLKRQAVHIAGLEHEVERLTARLELRDRDETSPNTREGEDRG